MERRFEWLQVPERSAQLWEWRLSYLAYNAIRCALEIPGGWAYVKERALLPTARAIDPFKASIVDDGCVGVTHWFQLPVDEYDSKDYDQSPEFHKCETWPLMGFGREVHKVRMVTPFQHRAPRLTVPS